MASIINKVVYGSIGLAVLFVLLPNLVMPFFNTSYNYTITGLAAATTQGILLLVFILALIGFAVDYIPRTRR